MKKFQSDSIPIYIEARSKNKRMKKRKKDEKSGWEITTKRFDFELEIQ